jgi:hypothetical protein
MLKVRAAGGRAGRHRRGAAQTAAGGKKELVAKVLQLQQPGLEQMARSMAEQPPRR